MQEKIIAILKEMTEGAQLELNYSGQTDIINDVGLDSLGMVNFLLRIEEELGIDIDISKLQVAHLNSIDGLCRFLDSKIVQSKN